MINYWRGTGVLSGFVRWLIETANAATRVNVLVETGRVGLGMLAGKYV
ncbi:MAG: hypothetical protein RJA70_614 [Pseudomonadota bacterium]